MGKIRVVVIGLGKRGKVHLASLLKAGEYFEVVGICNRSSKCLEETAEAYGISPDICYNDAGEMVKTVRPDAMVFVTMPDVRLSMIELAAKYNVKGVLFEKPMALSLEEAKKITDICTKNGIKSAVCHQHKYLRSFRLLDQALKSGELGNIYEIRAKCQAWASQLGTHYIDYMMWANGFSKPVAVVGHVHGSRMLADTHPSPDYMMAQIAFENGVRGYIECGYFSRPTTKHAVMPNIEGCAEFWTDSVLTVYGEYGYASAACNGKFEKYTRETAPCVSRVDYGGFGKHEELLAQDQYTLDFGRWMRGEMDWHPCDVKLAYRGFEVLEGIYLSALDMKCVTLPLKGGLEEDCIERLKGVLTPCDYDYQIRHCE